MYETIQYTVQNGVATLELSRPDKLNAFNSQMICEIITAVKEASKDKQVRCLVFTGAGRGFCSGQDLADVDENMDHGQVLREQYGPMMKQLMSFEKPIVAAVNGIAAGAGFSLALACDFRLASEKANFLNAFINIGLIPDSGNLYFLQNLVGYAKAAELSILGEKISAEKAFQLGLVTKVISTETWESEVNQFSEYLANLPTKAIGLIKRNLKLANNLSFDSYLEKEAEGQRIAGLTNDHQEGVQAFVEKRKPIFIGN
ncbi:enoyl-CoA hydratase/isomerase family protein [Bacillus sp. V3B]|uniref:enoyl-CoA hydratase-related protein n=1 Tax=Bacillus sp. V3B TaxID=2804915 RepID=UPI002109AC82|nr:enoyl-CoA hydratase-related protein [Bacillus sp. V3B]MCQ6275968.1 enoyl-CoA hydratase/isomerase family protein [Bacillus sp. V3B]